MLTSAVTHIKIIRDVIEKEAANLKLQFTQEVAQLAQRLFGSVKPYQWFL